MKSLSKKTIHFSVAAGVVVVCITIFVGVFALAPQFKAVRAVEDRIREVEQELVSSKTSGHSDNVNELRKELSWAKKSLSRYVISPAQASDLTVDIGRVAKQAGVHGVHSTNRMQRSYGPINECRHISEGRIQITFESSFSQFASFISLLERYEPVMFVDTFRIKRSKDNDGKHHVEMVLTFFVGQDSLTDIIAVDDFSLGTPGLAAGPGSAVN